MPRAPRDMRATQNGECQVTELAKDEFRKKLDALIGTADRRDRAKPTVAPDPVNQPMIRHWAYALDDMNPVYLDPEFAEKSRFGGIVSPPVMLQAWTMPRTQDRRDRRTWRCADRDRDAIPRVHRRGRLHRHRGHQLRVRDRALSRASATRSR